MKFVYSNLLFPVSLSGLAALLLSACSEPDTIIRYTIPKEESSPPPMAAAAPQTAPATAASPQAPAQGMTVLPGMAEQSERFPTPDMTAPEHWVAQPLGTMRKGSWRVPVEGSDAFIDVSVLVFPGDTGGLLANVNRWRGEVGLPDVTAATLQNGLEKRTVGDHPAHTMYLKGASRSTLGAIVPVGDGTWFFKATGPTPAVDAEQTEFSRFLETVRFK